MKLRWFKYYTPAIYNYRFTTHDALSAGKLSCRRQVNRRIENQSYGRKIPESKPEENRPETIQSQQLRRIEEGGCGQQAGCRQEKITVCLLPSLSESKSGETDFFSPRSPKVVFDGRIHPASLQRFNPSAVSGSLIIWSSSRG